MTTEEEANLWQRIVALEEKVSKLETVVPPGTEPDPPRDRHMPHDDPGEQFLIAF